MPKSLVVGRVDRCVGEEEGAHVYVLRVLDLRAQRGEVHPLNGQGAFGTITYDRI